MATVASIQAEIKGHEKHINDLRLHHISPITLELAAKAGKSKAQVVEAGVAHHEAKIAELHKQLSVIESQWKYKFNIGDRVVYIGQTQAGTVRSRRFGDYKVTWDDGQFNDDTFGEDELEKLKK